MILPLNDFSFPSTLWYFDLRPRLIRLFTVSMKILTQNSKRFA